MSNPNPVFDSPSGVGDDGKSWRYKDSTGVGELYDPATQVEMDAHLADSTDAHAASAITFTSAGTVAATTVQAAIAEVASEAAQKSANLADLTNAATARANLSLALGANVQAWDADLDGISTLAPADNDVLQRKSGAWANRTPAQLKTDLAVTNADVGLGNVPNTDATARAAHTGTQLASTVSDFNTAVRTSRLDQMAAPTAPVVMGSQRVTTVADPTSPQDAATKAYVDALATGLDPKASVRVATIVAGTLATSFENGDTVDGVTLATGDRVLVKNQAAGAENGIYVVAVSGAPTRSTDADTSGEVNPGMFTFVEEGTTQADTGWVLATNAPITLDTTALSFTQFSGGGANPNMGGDLTGTASNAQIVAGAILNADINSAAAIALSKLATDPLARANHTGTQALSTLATAGTATSGTFLRGDGAWSATTTGEMEHTTNGTGVILRSPNGTRYRIAVEDSGALNVTAA